MTTPIMHGVCQSTVHTDNLELKHYPAWGSVRRSSVPFSRKCCENNNRTDDQQTCKVTRWHHWIYAAYYRWCVTRHYRTELVEATLFLADIFPDEPSVHKEFQPAQIKSSETATSQMTDAICNFTDPFSVENRNELFCIASGKPARFITGTKREDKVQ